jgi:hypothetical protein
MNKRILLKSQKNEIHGILKSHGFDPLDFNWFEVPSDLDPDKIISRIVYNHSDFFYSFEMQGEAHFAIFSPARHSYIGTDYPGTWDSQCISFSNWLHLLFKETTAPDLWKRMTTTGSNTENSHHTYVAEPTDQSPDPVLFSSRLDSLLEKTRKTTEDIL